MKLLTGDFDVFGDASATLLSTPRHTPGHQSFLVHLDKTGWLLLTGDAAHFKDNWDNDRMPSMNTSAEQTHISHARLAGIVAGEGGGPLDQSRFAHFRQPQAFSRFLRVTSIVAAYEVSLTSTVGKLRLRSGTPVLGA